MANLAVSLVISDGVSGIQLNNRSAGYALAADARRERSITWRKTEATNPFVEGSYVTSAVKENITEQVAVYVYGSTALQCRNRVEALIAAYSQIRYSMTWTLEGAEEVWACMPADVQIGTQKEYQFARMALVTATVPRHPTAVLR